MEGVHSGESRRGWGEGRKQGSKRVCSIDKMAELYIKKSWGEEVMGRGRGEK